MEPISASATVGPSSHRTGSPASGMRGNTPRAQVQWFSAACHQPPCMERMVAPTTTVNQARDPWTDMRPRRRIWNCSARKSRSRTGPSSTTTSRLGSTRCCRPSPSWTATRARVVHTARATKSAPSGRGSGRRSSPPRPPNCTAWPAGMVISSMALSCRLAVTTSAYWPGQVPTAGDPVPGSGASAGRSGAGMPGSMGSATKGLPGCHGMHARSSTSSCNVHRAGTADPYGVMQCHSGGSTRTRRSLSAWTARESASSSRDSRVTITRYTPSPKRG